MNQLAEHPRQIVNHRAIWENQDGSLRTSVIEELLNWAKAYRGGYPDLGYAHEQPWYTPPRDSRDKPQRAESEPDLEAAQATEDTFVMWRLISEHEEIPPHKSKELSRLHEVAVLRFIKRKHTGEIAKRLHVSARHARRLIEEMLYRFWVLRGGVA